MEKTKIILKAENISKSYYTHEEINVLSNVCLVLKKGESIAIKGASGEGKTTLLHILGLLEYPSKGQLYINDQQVNARLISKLRNSHIGFIFQTYNLLEDLTVLDNVLMPAKIARNYSKQLISQKIKLLEEVNLQKKIHVPVKFLSGGEKQRVAIARSFCMEPEIILADEPSGNLDHANSKNIHDLLISSVRKKNKSLIVATHDDNLAALCDKKLILKKGFLKEDLPEKASF